MLSQIILNMFLSYGLYLYSKTTPKKMERIRIIGVVGGLMIFLNVAVVSFSNVDSLEATLIYLQVVFLYFLLSYLTSKEETLENWAFFLLLLILAFLLPEFPNWVEKRF